MSVQQWLINAMRPPPKPFDPSTIDPTITGGEKFWGGLQQQMENFPRMTLADKIQNPIMKFPVQAVQDIVNAPMGDPLRAGVQIGKDARTGELNNFQTQVSDLGQAALPIITLLSLAHGVPSSMKAGMGQTMGQAAWQGAKAAAPWGAVYGAASGLAGGRNQSPADMTKNTLLEALTGLLGSAVLGAGIGMGSSKLNPRQVDLSPNSAPDAQTSMPWSFPGFENQQSMNIKPALNIAKDPQGQQALQYAMGKYIANHNDSIPLSQITAKYLPQFVGQRPEIQFNAWDSINNTVIQPEFIKHNISAIIPALQEAIKQHLGINPVTIAQNAIGGMLNPLTK